MIAEDQEIEVRMYGMSLTHRTIHVRDNFDIQRFGDGGIVWCHPGLHSSDYCGKVILISYKHILILDKNGERTIFELKTKPKLTHYNLYCFRYNLTPIPKESPEELRQKFLKELSIESDKFNILVKTWPLGDFIDEFYRLQCILHFNKPTCPQCDKIVSKIYQESNSYMNSYQFDTCKAGDYYCESCPSNDRGKTALCYWWNSEVYRGPYTECFTNG